VQNEARVRNRPNCSKKQKGKKSIPRTPSPSKKKGKKKKKKGEIHTNFSPIKVGGGQRRGENTHPPPESHDRGKKKGEQQRNERSQYKRKKKKAQKDRRLPSTKPTFKKGQGGVAS